MKKIDFEKWKLKEVKSEKKIKSMKKQVKIK